MPIHSAQKKSKLFVGASKVKQAYQGATKVYSAGNICTYHVDSGITYQEEVDEGVSCLSPKTFTPSKSGWTFVGWRSDATTNPDCYTSYNMGDSPVTLYAVFSQAVTVTYYNGRTIADQQTKHRYYNNGNIADPSFALTQAALSGWTFIGWSQSSDPTAAISYSSIYNLALDSNITIYATYKKSFQITYSANGGSGSTEPTIGYAYSNSVNVKYPTVVVAGNSFSRSGYTFTGWSSYSVGQSITLTSDITLSAQWKQNNTPYSIVESWVVQPGIPTIKWVSEKTAVAQKWSVGSAYPSVNAVGYEYEDNSELQAYIDIPTKGNSSMEIRIDSRATNGDGGDTWIEVNGNRVKGHSGVWSISGLSTVRVRVHAFNWGYAENAFVQFQTWKLY